MVNFDNKLRCENCFQEIEAYPCPICGYMKNMNGTVPQITPTSLNQDYQTGSYSYPYQGNPAQGSPIKNKSTLTKVLLIVVPFILILIAAFLVWKGISMTKAYKRENTVEEYHDPVLNPISEETNNTYEYTFEYWNEGYWIINEDGSLVEIVNDDGSHHISAMYMDKDNEGGIIYDAQDYIDRINADNSLLLISDSDTDLELSEVRTEENENGYSYTVYSYKFKEDGQNWRCDLNLYDGKGNYGCYALYSLVLDDAAEADDMQEKGKTCAESFEVTGAYDPGEFDIYPVDDIGIKFSSDVPIEANMDKEGMISIVYDRDGEDSYLYLLPGELFGDDYMTMFTNIVMYVDQDMELTSDMVPLTIGRYDTYLVKNQYIIEDGVHDGAYDGMFVALSVDKAESKYKTYIIIGDQTETGIISTLITSFRFKGAKANNMSEVDDTKTLPLFYQEVEQPDELDLSGDGFLISESDKRLLTEDDVDKFVNAWVSAYSDGGISDEAHDRICAQGLSYARNEIFARHGYIFGSKELQDIFGSMAWYEGTVEPKDFDYNVLSSVEQQNVELLKDKMNEYGGYLPAR
ncbi:MAG: YARHG domain-containing protein [Lachnospiraceae bacterium]|nr:YARHG domain-containing protein [Lachnospiraceae bacterium]